ncbi:MAG: glucose-6-phosphate dehydrogenase, partial [Paracoccaceae bacterium]
MVSRVIPVEPFDLVIFGGTGDLARRKILPGLFRRFLAGQMPGTSQVIGAARSDMNDDAYRAMIRDAIGEFGGANAKRTEELDAFLQRLRYVAIDAKGEGGWKELAKLVDQDRVNAYYFSVAPG